MMIRPPSRIMRLATLASLSLASASFGGLVVTKTGRQEGALAAQPGVLRVGDAAVNLPDVLLAFNDRPATRSAMPVTLYARSGEIWRVTLEKLADGQLSVVSDAGPRTVAAALLQAIDFTNALPTFAGGEGGVLYRAKGKPTPCSLLWIDESRAGIDTPLGAIAVSRPELQRYIFSDPPEGSPPAAAADADELGLADGSIFRGQLEADGEGLVLKHAVFGSLRARPDTWQWIRRRPAGLAYLAEVQPASVETFPLIRQQAPTPRIEPSGSGQHCVGRISLWPKTIVRYQLPGGNLAFRGALSLAPGSRGAAQVRFVADSRTVFEQTLAPDAPAPVLVAFESPGGAFSMEVDFSKEVRFPCRVVLDDAYVAPK
jgi:hypothetical protein